MITMSGPLQNQAHNSDFQSQQVFWLLSNFVWVKSYNKYSLWHLFFLLNTITRFEASCWEVHQQTFSFCLLTFNCMNIKQLARPLFCWWRFGWLTIWSSYEWNYYRHPFTSWLTNITSYLLVNAKMYECWDKD